MKRLLLQGAAGLMATLLASPATASDPTEKWKKYGEGKGDIPDVDDSDSIMGMGGCRTVLLSSAPLRVASVVRSARKELRDVTAEEIEAAARPVLSVYYSHRAPHLTKQSGWQCKGSRPPIRIVLMNADGSTKMEPSEAFVPGEREVTYGSGAQVTVHTGYAVFEAGPALKLAGAGDLKVAVIYDGENKVFEIKAKKLRDLDPAWSR